MTKLSIIKKMLGDACSLLAFSNDKYLKEDGSWERIHCIRAYMKNDDGGKDKINLALDKTPSELTDDDYQHLFYVLNSRSYEQQ